MLSSFGRRLIDLVRRVPFFGYAGVLLLALALSLWIRSPGRFPDPDSFYHARMAVLTAEQGPVHHFPWLTETVFVDSYVDHHFLYHVLLIPFVKLVPSLANAMQLSVVVFVLLFTLVAVVMLRRLGLKGLAFVAALFLLTSNPLFFRLNLAKVPALSLTVLFLALIAIARVRPVLLGALAFLYVWLYDGWIILPVLMACFLCADVAFRFLDTPSRSLSSFWRAIRTAPSWRLVGAMVLGLVLGHIINPYAPENIPFEWLHVVRIGLIGFRQHIPVGAEWYPYGLPDLIGDTWTSFGVWIVGGVAFLLACLLARERRMSLDRRTVQTTLALFLFSLIACVFAVRSRRNVEYFVPFAVFAGFLGLHLFFQVGGHRVLLPTLQKLFGRLGKIGTTVIVFGSLGLVSFCLGTDIRGVKQDFATSIPFNKYQDLAGWLEANTPKDSIVCSSDWDDFPYIFAWQTHNRFLVALDPTFMYVKNRAHYDEWVGITRNTIKDDIARRFRDDFQCSYALIDIDHPELQNRLAAETGVTAVFQGTLATIYALPPKK